MNRKTETIEPTASNGSRPTTFTPTTKRQRRRHDRRQRQLDTYAYNIDGRQTADHDALGDTTTTVYDAVGNVLRVTDALGWTTTFQYDTMDRKIAEIDPLPQAGDQSAGGRPAALNERPRHGARLGGCRRRPHDHLDLRRQWQRGDRDRSTGNTTWTQYNG